MADDGPDFSSHLDGMTLHVSFVERADAPDIVREVLFGRRLTDWASQNSRILSITATPLGDGTNRIDVQIDMSDLSPDSLFMRMDWNRQP